MWRLGFPLSLSEWSFTICSTPYNRKQNVLSASLNKTFHSCIHYYTSCRALAGTKPITMGLCDDPVHHTQTLYHGTTAVFNVSWRDSG